MPNVNLKKPSVSDWMPHAERGSAMVTVMLLTIVVIGTTFVAVQASLTRNRVLADQQVEQELREIAESAASQALTRVKRGGITSPVSGDGTNAAWIDFGQGQFYYDSTYDSFNDITMIRVWSRRATGANPSSSSVSPDSGSWDGTGWELHGLEVAVVGEKKFPRSPAYFGNGGIERPYGGFDWGSGVDPADPTTWRTVSSANSKQASWIPLSLDARDFPIDYLTNGGSPAATGSTLAGVSTGSAHPFPLWANQTEIGQFNTDAWFTNSAGSGSDPTTGLTPAPGSTNYVYADPDSESHPYPVDTNLSDVQDFSWALWNKYASDPAANLLSQGSRSGTYGTIASPEVTFVTGGLTVRSGTTFKGTGVLVIRDDFDPNVQTNNTPGKRAGLYVSGTFEWTGLVIVAGWAPTIDVNSSGSMKVVGSLFGEDSVQSGGEVSLDSATINLYVDGPLEIYYSDGLFTPGGLIDPFIPNTTKRIVGMREITN